MAKKVVKVVKLQVEAMKATPAPPIGTALGPTGINIGDFCSQFNEQTKDRKGEIVPARLEIFDDRTFSFVLKSAPASYMLKKAAGIEKGSGKNLVSRAGSLTRGDLKKIAESKMQDINARDVDQAIKIIEGTARSMGIEIKG